MAAEDVRPETVGIVVAGVLAEDFGYAFITSHFLGRAVQARYADETAVRASFSTFGCDSTSARTWLGCSRALTDFQSGLRSPLPSASPIPACLNNGLDLLTGNGLMQLLAAIRSSYGEPSVVSLVRAIPDETLRRAAQPPDGLAVVNSPFDGNPDLSCTIHAWRRWPDPPNRWLAILERLRCHAH
jgi:hypothetical protein